MKIIKINPSHTTSNPPITFADVLRAVEADPDLTRGVRGNMKAAVLRCSQMVGQHGLAAALDMQLIANRLGKATPAKLGFANPNSLAAFRSNLRRALRLAGVTVMPGRHQTPLSAVWSDLAARARGQDDPFLWTAMSRFVHYLSVAAIGPDDVDDGVFAQFGIDLRTTGLNSKTDKIVRNTARAWNRARQTIPGWPLVTLTVVCRKSDVPLLPWSDFPPSLEEDVRRFLDRDGDWLSEENFLSTTGRPPLRPTTVSNYRNGLRRVASLMVTLGAPPAEIGTLADLVRVDRVKGVLKHVAKRTGRTQGGHVMFLALLLYLVGREHVQVTGKPLEQLEAFFKKTRPDSIGMSDRTLNRYTQFDDPDVLDQLIRLPKSLMARADKDAVPSLSSAKRARLALFLALLSETCARSGNIVGLNLETHIVAGGTGKHARTFAVIPAHEVKNSQEIRAELSAGTAALLRHYIDRYRHLHCSQPSPWLFPRQDGTHWTTTQACTDLKDIVARHLGVDVTPHLMRSLAGKIILDAQPGAVAVVQQLLGHKRIDTTLRFYARLDPQKARSNYQAMLQARLR
jgi:integrase